MFFSLSSSSFVRFYGSYAYFYDQITKKELLIENIDIFKKMFSRNWQSKEICMKEIIDNLRVRIPPHIVQDDFENIFSLLLSEDFIIYKNDSCSIQHFAYKNLTNNNTPLNDISLSSGDIVEHPKEILQRFFYKNPTIFTLSVDLTSSCTERCIHCYIPEYNSIFIDTEKLFTVIDEFANAGGLKIKFTGGECMLHPDFTKIIRYARKKDLIITVLTNLTACTSEIIKVLYEENVEVVQTSIYGMSAEIHDSITQLPGSYHRTMHYIKELYNNNIPLQFSCPVMKTNIHEYKKVIEFGKSMGIRVDSDYILTAKTNHDCTNLKNRASLTELEYFIREYKTNEITKTISNKNVIIDKNSPVCEVGTNLLCLSAQGKYYPCNGAHSYVVGDYSMPLMTVWTQSPQLNYLRSLKWHDLKKCPHCKKNIFCKVCPLKNFNEQKDITNPPAQNCKIADIKNKIAKELTQGR